MGKLYKAEKLNIKTRAELLASINTNYWKDLRPDTGELPLGYGDRPIDVRPGFSPRSDLIDHLESFDSLLSICILLSKS